MPSLHQTVIMFSCFTSVAVRLVPWIDNAPGLPVHQQLWVHRTSQLWIVMPSIVHLSVRSPFSSCSNSPVSDFSIIVPHRKAAKYQSLAWASIPFQRSRLIFSLTSWPLLSGIFGLPLFTNQSISFSKPAFFTAPTRPYWLYLENQAWLGFWPLLLCNTPLLNIGSVVINFSQLVCFCFTCTPSERLMFLPKTVRHHHQASIISTVDGTQSHTSCFLECWLLNLSLPSLFIWRGFFCLLYHFVLRNTSWWY